GHSLASGPVASLAPSAERAAAMRRHANTSSRGISASKMRIPGAQGVQILEGGIVATVTARAQRTRAGWFDRGAREEDDPETWETHVCPTRNDRSYGDPVTTPRRAACPRRH